jgi:hypothetical protein
MIALTAGQKSAEGVLGHVVGKASEALRRRKVEAHESRERQAAEHPVETGLLIGADGERDSCPLREGSGQ